MAGDVFGKSDKRTSAILKAILIDVTPFTSDGINFLGQYANCLAF